ncbi:MAG: hypothetical protein OXP36_09265, partial [Gammaproteobacteria bacterium]|nr:hypothetical protein [Gammaproteobacteria bacterium]
MPFKSRYEAEWNLNWLYLASENTLTALRRAQTLDSKELRPQRCIEVSQDSDVIKQPTAIFGFAISAVVAHSILAQTPPTTVGEPGIATGSDGLLLDQSESPVDNAQGLVEIGEYPE